ncbi:MAG: PAS domain-containing protein [Candidatus Margulisbacteria bacterium]|nr:PAS domain-containing protein [Candidatus Margulisiibacteriota bacterium]
MGCAINNKLIAPAFRVTLIYAILGVIWIISTDLIIEALVTSPKQMTIMQTYKGIAFVLISTLTVFLVAYREMVLKLKAEGLQLHAEKYFDNLFSHSATPSLLLKQGKIASANQAFLVMFGLPSFSELAGKDLASLSPEKQPGGLMSKEKAKSEIETALAKGANRLEWLFARKDGSIFLGDIAITSIGSPEENALYVTANDITERKKREDHLKKSEEAYRTLAENLPGLVFRCHLANGHQMEFFNNMLGPLTGFTPDELKKGEFCSFDPIIHPDDKQFVFDTIKEVTLNNKPFRIEFRLLHKTGDVKYVIQRGRPVYDESGKAIYIDGVFFDLTESKRTEKSLAESEKKFQTLFEVSPNPLFVEALDGKVLDCNSAAAAIFGYGKEEFLKLNTKDLVPPDVASSFPELVKAVLEKGEFQVEALNKKKNGTFFPAAVRIKAIEINGQKCVLTSVQDITEQKAAEIKTKDKIQTLAQISDAATGRELRLIEMEKEVNLLQKELGREPKYK